MTQAQQESSTTDREATISVQVKDLQRGLDALLLRTTMTHFVVRDASHWVDDNEQSLELIISDVVATWQSRDSDEPTDMGEFWNSYANKIEYAAPETGNEYREEFCPARGGSMDTDDYYRAVWRVHVAELLSLPRQLP